MSQLPSFTVFDTETTGLDPRKGDKIIEIAGVRIEDGVIREDLSFVKYVNPERSIPWEAKRVNHIEDSDVAGAQTIDQVLPQFLEFAKGSILVAHNCDFDMNFLLTEKELCWGYIEMPECLCTMRLSRCLYPSEFRHNLDSLAARLSIPMPKDRHRAMPDVLMTAQALLKMIEDNNINTPEQLRKLAGKQRMVA
ncbi:MAG: 3'-5' exonuclease [Candidatus Peribacter sp.]|jgi:DNA polymerase III subunit epsilon|nr:3'-5' exonuclease [Candidatus Peribacter sp.]MBT4393303.1 3'-5' exonuclease [Candidatus Peribacter sp.]MBT4601198.1 3'-5' exonuclease [Candidatus Peribacter sp.]MBT5148842.1 3'-5' exonuclease [Candidatus Peribacter sp.]MBT5637278.1 3'-5' exonuclease [Candidatus Peribacter sp.]